MSSLHYQLRNSALQGCLAGGLLPLSGASRAVRSGGSFLTQNLATNLLGYWNTGTLLSLGTPLVRIAKSLCLAGEEFRMRFVGGERVAAASSALCLDTTLLEY